VIAGAGLKRGLQSLCLFAAAMPVLTAGGTPQAPRHPQGVYVIVGPAELSAIPSLVKNPAISGLDVYVQWSVLNPNAPAPNQLPTPLDCSNLPKHQSSDPYDWSLTDAAFCAVAASTPPKTVQLVVRPGFDSPQWILDQINTNSCSGQFVFVTQPYYVPASPMPPEPPNPSPTCHLAYFYFNEGLPVPANQNLYRPLPMPWDSTYKSAWQTFLLAINARYGQNPAFVSIAVAGPTAESDETLLPNVFSEITWWSTILRNQFSDSRYWNSDQAFIDEWQNSIDTYGQIFSDVTLVLILCCESSGGLVTFSAPYTPPTGASAYCGASPNMGCGAVYSILSYFVQPGVGGRNAKALEDDGLSAAPGTVLGPSAVKLMTGSTAQSTGILGGLQFGGGLGPYTVLADTQTLCPDATAANPACSPQQAFYNTIANIFDGTAASALAPRLYDAATISHFPVLSAEGTKNGAAPLNYIQLYTNSIPPSSTAQVDTGVGASPSYSGQDLLNLASQGIAQIAEQPPALAPIPPVITLVANAEGESPTIAPNTWVEIKGSNLAPAGDSRIWQGSDFVNGQMPAALDGVSVTVNGKSAFVYYISPTQVNILTPPDAMTGSVQVVVTNNGTASAAYTAQAQALSPSFFVFNGGPYVAATHADGSFLGPAGLYAGLTTPAKPGETVVLYANGFGPTSTQVVSGSSTQSGSLVPPPVISIGGTAATVTFAGLVAPGEYQFNVVIPNNTANGDNTLTATYNGAATSPQALIAIQGSASVSSMFYVAPNGNDSWSGTLAAPNAANTDGPFATFDHARAAVQSLNKGGLSQVTVQFRGGMYFLSATEQLTAADSGTAGTFAPELLIVYENYPGEAPVISGGVRVQNWTNVSGNVWKTTLPASTQYFENFFYNGVRRLRPRLGGYLGTYFRVEATVYLNAPGAPASAPDPNCAIYVTGKGWECFDRFQYTPADPIANTWRNLAPQAGNHCSQPAGNAALAGDIELVDFEQYNVSKFRISCVDTANHIVYLTGPADMNPNSYAANGFIPKHRYVVENVQDQLTQAGQWFLDRSTTPWTLTYLANSGEDPNTDTVVIPQLTQVLIASNLQYVQFRGLTFAHDNYTLPDAGYNGTSPASAAVSFQNSQAITFDSSIVAHTSGAGLEFISCINTTSPSWCVSRNANAVTFDNSIVNSAFYDIASSAVRIGMPGRFGDTAANTPQSTMVANNVVEGWGRVFPDSKGILGGNGHDNTYTHNDVYDGYHGAIGVCYCSGLTPFTNNNTISFNHVYNLFQGIGNDGGSLYFGTAVFAQSAISSTGNKMLNNKVHDVSDASTMDDDGYGGDGLYIDDFTGSVDVENNLVYRVSGNAVSFSGPRAGPNQTTTIKNNILAFARRSLINAYNPYSYNTAPPADAFFTASNNLFYFDRNSASSPTFYAQGGCTYSGGIAYTAFQQWNSNLYWRTDGGFANDAQAFHVQPSAAPTVPCYFGNSAKWTFFDLSGWQKIGEDVQSVVQDPGFKDPAYPADDYSMPKGSPGVGFVVFDPNQAGRNDPVINPPAVPATFVTKSFNFATDY